MPSATIEAPTSPANPTSDVEGHSDVGRKLVESSQGRADGCKLELDIQPDLDRLGVPGRERTHLLRPEAVESLERDYAAVEQIEDWLELDVYVIRVEDR